MRVIFLDIDGVLNTTHHRMSFSRLHESLVRRAAGLVHRTQAHVVLSSTWRVDAERLDLLKRTWRRHGLPANVIMDATPQLVTTDGGAHVQRAREIQAWLAAQPPTTIIKRWVAVDDLDLAQQLPAECCVRTDPSRGLSADDVKEIASKLGEEELPGDAGFEGDIAVDWRVMALQQRFDAVLVALSTTRYVVVDVATMEARVEAIEEMGTSATSLQRWAQTCDPFAAERGRLAIFQRSPDDTAAAVAAATANTFTLSQQSASVLLLVTMGELTTTQLSTAAIVPLLGSLWEDVQMHGGGPVTKDAFVIRVERELGSTTERQREILDAVVRCCGPNEALAWVLAEHVIRRELSSVTAVGAVGMLVSCCTTPTEMLNEVEAVLTS